MALTHRLLAASAVLTSGRLAVACDLTAAHIWSLVLPGGFGLAVDAQACAIATARGGSRHRTAGLRGRRLDLPADHIVTVDGTPVTTPARTWIDCAPLISWADVVAMGDGILRAQLATRSELAAMVRWARGRRGVRNARLALAILDERAESPAESWTRALLHKGGAPRPECNWTVVVGRWEFRLDLAWPEAKVAVEYDGEEHHGREQVRHDEWRRSLLREDGWVVIVVRKDDLANMGSVATEVSRLVATRTPSGHSR